MGEASLRGYRFGQRVCHCYLRWRTNRNHDVVLRCLDALAFALESGGWRCVKTYHAEITPVRIPLLRVYGAAVTTTLCVMALPGGRWGFHDAPRGRGGFLCHCEDDIQAAAQVIDRFLRERPVR